MKYRRNKRTFYSLTDIMNRLILWAIPIILINIVISFVSVYNIRQQNYESIHNTVTMYQYETSAKIRAVQHFIQWSVVEEPLLRDLDEAGSAYDTVTAINALRARVNDTLYATGADYHYFIYLKRQNSFYNASEMHLPYRDYVSIKDHVIRLVSSGDSIKVNFSWQSLPLDDAVYLYYLIDYDNYAFATFIDSQKLTTPLNNINVGKRGFLRLTDPDGQELFSSRPSEENELPSSSLIYSMYDFPGKSCALPFDIHLYTDNFSNYGSLLLFQIFIILTAVGLSFILSGFVIFIYRKVIRPINAFSAALSAVNEQEELLNLQSSHIRELEQTSTQFRNLIREIKKLKISIYETELDKKRIQITFLQNRIRPHFYLNCLTTISSMAQIGAYEDIESMVYFTSQYLRYLFQTDREAVRLEYELSHIQAYLNIQALRYGPVFTYTCSIGEQNRAALIPPLLLITFVENILKHATSGNGKIAINLSVADIWEGALHRLKIDLTDSGSGFPDEILGKLRRGQSLDTGPEPHIGITNSIQRLALLYGDHYQIRFSNEQTGGAHIELLIPWQTEE